MDHVEHTYSHCLASTYIIVIYYYYSAQKLILILPSHRGRKAELTRHCSKGVQPMSNVSYLAVLINLPRPVRFKPEICQTAVAHVTNRTVRCYCWVVDGVLLMQGGDSRRDVVQSLWSDVRGSEWPGGQGKPVEPCVLSTVRSSSHPASSHSWWAEAAAPRWDKTSPADQSHQCQHRRSQRAAASCWATERSLGESCSKISYVILVMDVTNVFVFFLFLSRFLLHFKHYFLNIFCHKNVSRNVTQCSTLKISCVICYIALPFQSLNSVSTRWD